MRLKRCVKPGCGRIYNETNPEFHDGFCDCGAALVDYVDNPVEEAEPKKEKVWETLYEKEPEAGQKAEEQEVVDQEDVLEDELEDWQEDNKEDEQQGGQEDDQEDIQQKPSETGNYSIDSEPESDQSVADGPSYIIDKDGRIIYRGDAGYNSALSGAAGHTPDDVYAGYEGDRLEIYFEGKIYKTVPLQYDEVLIGRKSNGEDPEVDYTDIDPERITSRRHALIIRQQGRYIVRNISTKNTVQVNKQLLLERQEAPLEHNDRIILSGKYGLIFKTASDGERQW
ncbi:hypothetical protein PCCS19_50040 [Paenibacillus sp. CCS19]|uniref:FHA domain-containing protein n=1 Tax=Paenibacillus sp. CCS19 TaxID=3158387 RepID=UPI002561E66B|nr:FHA domain-containing protein [Paenibacillus cellulosilyticus]GMK41945.1 hypothetical protein PCCS19_50040 [Paenibacillus cellulosilyticus]